MEPDSERREQTPHARHTSATPADDDAAKFPAAVGRKESRRLKARRGDITGLWYGLGMFGMVGWSVAIPTLIGVAIGIWLDRHSDRPYSFTLMGVLFGVLAGCGVAWYWVTRESTEEEGDDEPATGSRETRMGSKERENHG